VLLPFSSPTHDTVAKPCCPGSSRRWY
jgi:hypothetical protein